MSIQKALLAQARPRMLQVRAREILAAEISKGCRPEISDLPVALEPPYQSFLARGQGLDQDTGVSWALQTPATAEDLCRLIVWVHPDQECDWLRSELLVKQLSHVRYRVAFEVVGNASRIVILLLCHRSDLPVVRAAFAGQFEQCELTDARKGSFLEADSLSAWAAARFWDFFPSPPYSHLLTSPDELRRSPYATLVTALAGVSEPSIGFYQVVFAPVSPLHDWHHNVRALLNVEYRINQIDDPSGPSRYPQQVPSDALNVVAQDVICKAHNDKPFFATALRVGLVDGGEDPEGLIRSLGVVGSLLQHGGRPLSHLTERDYQPFGSAELQQMFTWGLTHRPGFLLNSWELTSLVHVPPPGITEHVQEILPPLETLPAKPSLAVGTPIGFHVHADTRLPVCIPLTARTEHVHMIGRPGTGKSSLLAGMACHDISMGHGMALLDPHGTLVRELLDLIPAEHADRVICVDPGDPDYVPVWNPLHCGAGTDLGRLADELVSSFKSFVSGWGHRLEHLLRQSFLAVLHLPRGSLYDVSNLLRKKSNESNRLRSQLREVLEGGLLRAFWSHDFDRYGPADLSPPQHKLSTLLTSGTVAYMLSQSHSSFDFRELMESGKILLVDLSQVGPEPKKTLGCFMLSLLYLAALSRPYTSGQSRLPFHIYCDEASLFLTDALEEIIAQTRKYDVTLTLAHQYMSQFTAAKKDALSSVGSTIIFNVNRRDARRLAEDLRGLAEADDLISLPKYHAIARIGNEVVRIRTYPPPEAQQPSCRDAILEQSRRRYCKPVDEVRRAILNRSGQCAGPLTPYGGGHSPSSDEGRAFAEEVASHDEW